MYITNKNGKPLVWIQYHTINGPITFGKHHHAFLELSCVMRGTATYVVNRAEYDMRPGDIFLFAPTDHHHLVLHNENLEHIVIHLDPSFIWNALGNDMDYKFLMVFFQRNAQFRCRLERDNPAAAQISQWFREIWQECQQQRDCYELMIKIKLQSILAQIIRSYHCIDESKAARSLNSGDLENMNRVLSYIDEHLDDEIRLADLAAIAHVSASYFSTIFKQYNGLPPVEYVVGQRIRRAIEYIRTTDMPLNEVAAACGFNNNTNFYKAFRRVTGRTPASYRRDGGYDDPSFPSQSPVKSESVVFTPQQQVMLPQEETTETMEDEKPAPLSLACDPCGFCGM